MTCIIVNNAYIAKLTNIIKAIISKQKQQAVAFIETNIYTTALRFKAATAAIESPLVREIPMHLIREIVIKCLNMTSENHT